MNNEKLYKIPGYPGYFLTESAKLYSEKSNRFLTIHTNTKGYKYVSLSTGSKNSNKNILLSRLMCFVFGKLDSLDSELEVDHVDGDITNNLIDNLNPLSKEDHRLKTYKNKSKNQTLCHYCNGPIWAETTTYKCSACVSKNSKMTEQEILELLNQYGSWKAAASSLGISDNALKKRWTKVSQIHPTEITKQIRSRREA